MDLKQENELIKWDAQYALEECEKRSDSRCLEKYYVVAQFLKEFSKMARDKGYLN
jgi:hypothetical protein